MDYLVMSSESFGVYRICEGLYGYDKKEGGMTLTELEEFGNDILAAVRKERKRIESEADDG